MERTLGQIGDFESSHEDSQDREMGPCSLKCVKSLLEGAGDDVERNADLRWHVRAH